MDKQQMIESLLNEGKITEDDACALAELDDLEVERTYAQLSPQYVVLIHSDGLFTEVVKTNDRDYAILQCRYLRGRNADRDVNVTAHNVWDDMYVIEGCL